jgi:hypothetical protein
MSSKDLLKEYIDRLDTIAAGQPIHEDSVDRTHLSDMLDQLEEHLNQAAGIASDLARYGRDLPGPFAGQIRSYLAPHLESFIDDRRQPGSIASLRNMLINSSEEEDEEINESQTFDHLTNKKLRRILVSGPKNLDEVVWAMDFTDDALRADYDDEGIDSRTFDARNNAFNQASEAFHDEDGEFNPDADIDATLTHLKQFWSV